MPPPILIYFLDANCAFRQIMVRVMHQAFSTDITLLGVGDTWPIPVSSSSAPDVVLLGIGAEGLVNPQLLTSIHAELPGVPILVLGHLDDAVYRVAAMKAGASAFLSKDSLAADLVPTLRQIAGTRQGAV
ncbi:MAG: hypothetical protein WCJ55_10450 [Chloroflexales bacterium]